MATWSWPLDGRSNVVPLGKEDESNKKHATLYRYTKPPVAAYHPVFTFQNTGSRSTLHICTIEIYAFLSAHSIASLGCLLSLIDSCWARFLVLRLSPFFSIENRHAQLHTDPLTADELYTKRWASTANAVTGVSTGPMFGPSSNVRSVIPDKTSASLPAT